MTVTRRAVAVTVSTVAAAASAVATAGCGTGSGPAASTTSTSAGATAVGASPGAAATESNPAGDIPDNQAYTTYRSAAGGFTVKVPEGWAQSVTAIGGVTFTDKYNSVTVTSSPAPAAPTAASVTAADLPALRRLPGFSQPRVSTVSRRGGSAVLVTYRADSAKNPVTGKVAVQAVERYTFWHAGTAAVIALAAPVGSDNVDPWRTVTDSFAWTP